MGTTLVTISDIGQALITLDQEYHALAHEQFELRHQAAILHLKEDAARQRMLEVEDAIKKLLNGGSTYPITRLGFREEDDA